MISRPVAVGLLAAGCLTAAAGGSYLAVRQNAAAAPVEPAAVSTPVTAPGQPVSETEAVVEPSSAKASEDTPGTAKASEEGTPTSAEAPVAKPAVTEAPKRAPRMEAKPAAPPAPRQISPRSPAAVNARSNTPQRTPEAPVATSTANDRPIEPVAPVPTETAAAPASPAVAPPVDPQPRVEAPAVPQIEEITIPASAVIGLEVETPITSERARLEDRVEARVSRDVYADGRVAIPAGSRVIGSVTLVEKGGKVKERARLGVRFNTLVLADGRQVNLRTDTIYREGQSPTGESSRKIGGAAIGGAVLGAIMGGKKGAILGGTAGAAGGTAAVMAGSRNAATIAGGTVLTARLVSPVTLEVERR